MDQRQSTAVGQGGADLAHPHVAQPSEAGSEACDRDIERGVELHHTPAAYRVFVGLKGYLSRQVPGDRAARCHDNPPQTRDRCVARQNSYRTPMLVGNFTPPNLSSLWQTVHARSAASRKSAKFPHPSSVSSGSESKISYER